MINLHDHPLAARFYDLAGELEKLPPSLGQTDLMKQLEALLFCTQHELNGIEQLIDIDNPVVERSWQMFLTAIADDE